MAVQRLSDLHLEASSLLRFKMRTTLRRDENAAILRQLLLHAEAHPTTLTAEETPYEFACECGASGCDATVRLSIPEYERSTSAIHPAHGG